MCISYEYTFARLFLKVIPSMISVNSLKMILYLSSALSISTANTNKSFSWFSLSLDCGCMHRGAAGGPTVERPRHPGADAWNPHVSRTVSFAFVMFFFCSYRKKETL